MQHKLLLGSTALVSAGLLMSGAVQAQEARVGGIEVVLGGFTEFGVAAGNKNTITNGGHDRSYTFYMDNELIIRANGATESGILYGSKVELEVGSGGIGSSQSTAIDEVGLYFSGNFGRVELGREDGAEDVMYVGGEDAQAGTGGIDAASFTRPTAAADLFPRLRGEIEAKGKTLAASAQYFTLGQ